MPSPPVPGPPSSAPSGPAIGPPGAPSIRVGNEPVPAAAPEPEEEELLHIPCPNGHELETPRDMLGQDVLCPHCQVQFQLRERDSVEFKARRERQLKIKEEKEGQAWLNFAIVAAVIVVLGLIALFVATAMG